MDNPTFDIRASELWIIFCYRCLVSRGWGLIRGQRRLTWGRSVNIEIQTVLGLRGQQPQTPPHPGRSPGAQPPRPPLGGVGQVRDVLRADGPEPVGQQRLLPGGHRDRGHEPEVAEWRSREGDAEEGGHGLEAVRGLVEDALHWAVLGGNIPENRNQS